MDIDIMPIGGFNEVGRNMTAIKVGNEVVICDMGFYMQKIVDFEEEGGDRQKCSADDLIALDAIPNDNVIDDWKKNVKAIVCSHCHMDHIGAVPYLASEYKCPIIGTPFTIEVLKRMIKDDNKKLKNPLKILSPNSKIKVSNNIEIELINITHSTLQTAMIAVHTKKGTIIYANDFKFDNHPVVGKKPNYKRLEELGKQNVIALVVDSIYSAAERKTPSERVARELLKDVLLGTHNENNIIIVTCFSSHLARIKSVIDFGKQLGRKIIILGRSMNKYIVAAEQLNLVNFSKKAEIIAYSIKAKRRLKELEKEDRNKYLLIVTGGQGEPEAVLSKMLDNRLPFKFLPEDNVIFSNRVIPVEPNIENRLEMERKLRAKKTRIFTDIHTSVLPDTEVVINDKKSMKIKKIEDVKDYEGLRVSAFDPNDLKIKWYNAKLIKHNYEGNIFKIKTKSGRSVGITSGHSVFVLRNGKILSIEGDNLVNEDYLAIPKVVKWDKTLNEVDVLDYLKIKKSKWNRLFYDDKWIYYAKRKISPRKIKLDKNFGKLLGYYLAEGCAPRHINLTFGSHERELINECHNCIKKVFPSKINIFNKGSAIDIQFGASILKEIFRKWFGNNAKEKKIPDFIFSANDEFKLSFLGAYINGDGHIENNKQRKKQCLRIRIKTVSKKLASDLLYLFSQVGILAKFDHKEIVPVRIIDKYKTKKESICYVIRIQDTDSIKTIANFLNTKLFIKIDNYLKNKKLYDIETVPLALPVNHINWKEIIAKKNSYLKEIKLQKRKKHIGLKVLKRDSINIKGVTNNIINGEILFDPIVEINKELYKGKVYDFSVPGAENFVGGFGGIMLHNSGHCGREDLRDLINIVKPKHIIPAHAELAKRKPLAELAKEMGYSDKNIHLVKNGQLIRL